MKDWSLIAAMTKAELLVESLTKVLLSDTSCSAVNWIDVPTVVGTVVDSNLVSRAGTMSAGGLSFKMEGSLSVVRV